MAELGLDATSLPWLLIQSSSRALGLSPSFTDGNIEDRAERALGQSPALKSGLSWDPQVGLLTLLVQCGPPHPAVRNTLIFAGVICSACSFLHPVLSVPMWMQHLCFPSHPNPERPSGPGSGAPFPGHRCWPFLPWPLWGAVAPLQGYWEGASHGTKPGFPLSVKPGFD